MQSVIAVQPALTQTGHPPFQVLRLCSGLGWHSGDRRSSAFITILTYHQQQRPLMRSFVFRFYKKVLEEAHPKLKEILCFLHTNPQACRLLLVLLALSYLSTVLQV